MLPELRVLDVRGCPQAMVAPLLDALEAQRVCPMVVAVHHEGPKREALCAILESRRKVQPAMKKHVTAKRQKKETKLQKVAIIGGGIGGLATALALVKAGVAEAVDVFERDVSFASRSQGYGLTLQQGTRAAKVLGLEELLLKEAAWSSRHFIFDSAGSVIAFGGRRYEPKQTEEHTQQWRRLGGHNLHIPRQALRKSLLDLCSAQERIKIRWGADITPSDAISLCDDHGGYDLVVGAGGTFAARSRRASFNRSETTLALS